MPDVLIPGATVRLLPEGDGLANDDQPAIHPTQLIAHTAVDGTGTTTLYNYWLGVNLESHCYVGRDGNLEQYMRLDRRADANNKANRRPDGTGAISFEDWDGRGSHDDGPVPFTDRQLATLIAAWTWIAREWDIPARVCRTHDDPGMGWHNLHPQWSPGPTGCPGDIRAAQVRDVIIPAVAAALAGATPATVLTRRDSDMQVFTNVLGLTERLDINPRTGRLRNVWDNAAGPELGAGSPVDGVYDSIGPALPIVDKATGQVTQVWFEAMGAWADGTPLTVMQKRTATGGVEWSAVPSSDLRRFLAGQAKR